MKTKINNKIEKTLNIHSITAHTKDAGSGEAVVLLHGNPGCSRDFDFVFSNLSGHFRVIAPDMPGFGLSHRPADFAYNVPAYTRFFTGLLDELGIHKAHLVMHDMGGAWGLSFTTLYPERVLSITLINTGLLHNYRWHYLARLWQTPLIGELFQLLSSKAAMKWALNAANPKPLPDDFIDRMAGYQDWGHKQTVLKLYRSLKENAAMQAMATDALSKLKIPVNVIWGADDAYLPVRLAHYQTEVWPQAKLSILQGLGHWPFVDAPDTVGPLVDEFLLSIKEEAAMA